MMAAADIRIAWCTVTGSLHAVHPDDGTFASVEIGWSGDRAADAHPDIQARASAPGGRRLIIGPTLGEILAAFKHGEV